MRELFRHLAFNSGIKKQRKEIEDELYLSNSIKIKEYMSLIVIGD
jgi:hypothetical protein